MIESGIWKRWISIENIKRRKLISIEKIKISFYLENYIDLSILFKVEKIIN